MVGIVSYGAYIPSGRLSSETRDWEGKHPRAVADFDEDAITMAVAAASDCLNGRERSDVDAIFFASTSAPYVEKQSASLIATAVDLSESIFATDISHSLRSGTQALRLALDGVKAGSSQQSLVLTADARPAAPGSHTETEGGDAAAALLLGNDNPIAELEATHSVVNDILDVWRADGEQFLRLADDHFRFEDGYLHAVEQCVSELLDKTGMTMEKFDRVIVYAPDARRHGTAIKAIGADPAKSGNELLRQIGSTGTSDAMLQLVAALEEMEPNKRILVVNYGDGADAMVFRTTDAIANYPRANHRGVAQHLTAARPVAHYNEYLRWRGLMVTGPNGSSAAAPAPHALWREKEQSMRFRGMRCSNCGMVQWPAQRVCVKCRTRDGGESIRLSDSRATLFTYSMDYVARTFDQPLVHGVVDFEIGGRAMMMIADRRIEDVAIGMPLEMSFRKFHYADGVHTYLWKAAPLRVEA